jgi:hypothetical protein
MSPPWPASWTATAASSSTTQPVVTGLVPVGDAWACINPTACRGFSLGLAHAITLRDVARGTLHEPVALVETFDRVTEETLTPWYRQQVDGDHQRAAEIQASIDGYPPPQANGHANGVAGRLLRRRRRRS